MPPRQRLAGLVDDLVDRQRVRVGVAVVVAEGAEQAAVAADVGVVDVAVGDEVDLVADRPARATWSAIAPRARRSELTSRSRASSPRSRCAGVDLAPRRGRGPRGGAAIDLLHLRHATPSSCLRSQPAGAMIAPAAGVAFFQPTVSCSGRPPAGHLGEQLALDGVRAGGEDRPRHRQCTAKRRRGHARARRSP